MMEYERRNINVYRQGETIVDQFYIDDDVNVPDSKDDAREVIMGEGRLCIEEVREVENYVKVSGSLKYKILYMTEDEEITMDILEGKLPFEEMVYKGEKEWEVYYPGRSQTEVSVTMIHSRKFNIKSLAEIIIHPSSQENITLVTDAEGHKNIFRKYREESLLIMNTLKNDTIRIREEIPIGGTKESLGNLLWTELESRKMETRIDDGELIIQGELALFCLYDSIEGKKDWIEEIVPYQGSISCQGAHEKMFHHVDWNMGDISIEPRMDEEGEMRAIGVEAMMEVRVLISEEDNIRILADVYTLAHDTKLSYTHHCAEKMMMQNHSKCRLSERLSLPEIKDDILQICHSHAKIRVEKETVREDGIEIEGLLYTNFLYISENDREPFGVWQGMVPFSFLLKINDISETDRYGIDGMVEQLSVVLLGSDEVEMKAVLAFNVSVKKPVVIANVTSMEITKTDRKEIEKMPGILGYICADGDQIWDLAKKYNTTIESIMSINEKETEDLKCGEKLLIFKENMSIL